MAEDKTKSTVTGDTTKSTVTINDETPKTETAESTANNAAKETDTAESTANNAAKETDTAEPWGDKAPVSEDDLINELFYHGGIAKNVAKEMIEKLKAATDTELKEAMINHIAWHIATGGPKNKENGGKGKALHKEDIVAYLNTL